MEQVLIMFKHNVIIKIHRLYRGIKMLDKTFLELLVTLSRKGDLVGFSEAMKELNKLILEIAYLNNRMNQVRTSKFLGISRGTLRKRLVEYFGDKYIG